MRLASFTALAALAAATLAGPAAAAFGETSWGASYRDTLDLLGPSASPQRDREGSRVWDQHFLIERPGTFEGIPVKEEYYFRRGRTLSIVRLQPERGGADCAKFVNAVTTTLGEPIDVRENDFNIFVLYAADFADEASDNVMRLAHVRTGDTSVDTCHLTFQAYENGEPGQRD